MHRNIVVSGASEPNEPITFTVDGTPATPGGPDERADPLQVASGDRYEFEVPRDLRASVLSRLEPGTELADRLDELEENGSKDTLDWLCAPYDVDVQVDGEPWGWLCVDFAHWGFLPVDFQDRAREILYVNLSEGFSRLGGNQAAGCVLASPICVSWYVGELENSSLSIAYDVTDPVEQVRQALAAFLPDAQGSCVEEDIDETLTLLAPSVPLNVIGSMLARFWHPCEPHEPDWRVELAGQWWRWEDNAWVPADS